MNAAPPPTLAGQVAIVTGAARGIGRGIARRLAAAGCRLVLWDRSFAAAPTADDGLAGAWPMVVDVTDAAAAAWAQAEVMARFGRVDILVNNAGINGPVAPVWDYPLDDWARVLAVNLGGVFHGCRAVVPAMRAAGYGRIVNVASIAGKEGVPGIAAYAAAKHGVIGFTKSLARELLDSGVLANCVAPVMAETDLLREMTPEHIAATRAKIPMGRFVRVAEIAETVAFAASPACSFTTGFTFDLSGGRADY
ncbi:SDR family NAD(P)-dependent oxidoreductase [Pseudorhodoferax sp.]|uniref:SDR family NAD(P)-dependent oxidoreductase n=1 Tax=Pseudorhodoferax sp. TaxID=1993553 RepID=UPI0039E37672